MYGHSGVLSNGTITYDIDVELNDDGSITLADPVARKNVYGDDIELKVNPKTPRKRADGSWEVSIEYSLRAEYYFTFTSEVGASAFDVVSGNVSASKQMKFTGDVGEYIKILVEPDKQVPAMPININDNHGGVSKVDAYRKGKSKHRIKVRTTFTPKW